MKITLTLTGEVAKKSACRHILAAPEGHVMQLGEPNRTLDQNAAQWPYLEAISKQVQWPVNGVLCWLTDEEFKDVLTAAFKQETIRLAAGVNGGVVMLGLRTSKFKKKEFSEWIEYLKWFCAEKSVVVYPEPERIAA